MGLFKAQEEAVAYLKQHISEAPEIAIVLGSGLSDFADEIEGAITIPYEKIPGFPQASHVKGHRGQLISGTLNGKRILCMAGRYHAYQGFPLSEVTLPIRILKAMGAHTLIVTNAAGGLNQNFNVGDLMIIQDHINAMGSSPMIGVNDERLGPRFIPMTNAYNPTLREIAEAKAQELSIPYQKGTYIAVLGTAYETPAEVNMYKQFADAVGMSTVPEVITANQIGFKVLGISCITNVHKPNHIPTHQEVVDEGKKAAQRFKQLVTKIIAAL